MAQRKIKSFVLEPQTKDTTSEPIKFTIGEHEFSAYGQVPGAVLLDFFAKFNVENSNETAQAILRYLKDSMDAENYKRFDALIHDPKVNIPAEQLSAIVGYLIEERTERPTEAS